VEKTNIKNLSIREIAALIETLGERRHRTGQILKWLFQKDCTAFSDMTNLPASLRIALDGRLAISSLRLAESVRSRNDASQKFLLESDDGIRFEAVLMEARGRRTLCVSSQAGCALGCTLCRTGAGGFERDLRSDEILNQILFFKNGYLPPRERFNVVFMGMGEPLLNFENFTRALEIINAEEAFALGEKRITVSTIGIPAAIRELASRDLKCSLAISLNATTDDARRRLMPASRGIDDTLDAAREFARARKARVTLEYVLIAEVNDFVEDARRLAALTAGGPFKINLIPFNEWDGCPYRRPSEDRIERFLAPLLPTAPAVTVRRSQGSDISAACGQLRWRR
jgi:23S rRNA (adenine2503-C2)-methyltransferase